MSKTNQRATQNYWIKPLTFATPLLEGESLTSWLVRAALNQGCSPLTLTFYFWPEYRIWIYDVDKGFEHIDSSIHADMAVLAKTTVDSFENQNLVSFSKETNNNLTKNTGLIWTQPLSKRNRYSRVGYPYCVDCIKDNTTAYLKLQWRFTWSICCTKHKNFLQLECPYCGYPYQPQLINPEQRYLNCCHSCHSKLDKVIVDTKPSKTIYQFQLLVDKVFHEKKGIVLGKTVSIGEWFDYLLFLINMIRLALRNPSYMFGKLLFEFGIEINSLSLPKTALKYDFLPIKERATLLEYAFNLFQINTDEWVRCCKALNVTQNSFHWSKRTVMPVAFEHIYSQLPQKPKRKHKDQSIDVQPTSPKAVMTAWNRLQRKIEMTNYYEKHLKDD